MKIAAILMAGALAGLAMPGAAQAAVPGLSGVYAYSATMTCQALITWTSGNVVLSTTNGTVLTGSTSGNVVTSVVAGQGVTSASTGQYVTSVDFNGQQTTTMSALAEATQSQVLVDSTLGTGVLSVTNGTGLLTATNGPAILTYAIGAGPVIHQAVGTLNFNAATHKANLKRTIIEGAALRKGSASVQKTTSKQNGLAFSNTATTVTLDGKARDAVYANVVGGVANHVDLLMMEANGCALRETLVRE